VNKDLSRYKDPEKRRLWLNDWKRNHRRNNPDVRKAEKERLNKRRNDNKWKAIQYLGGRCSSGKSGCNNIIATKENMAIFDFHHIENKEVGVATLFSRTWKKILKEIKKCVLECSNCHRLER